MGLKPRTEGAPSRKDQVIEALREGARQTHEIRRATGLMSGQLGQLLGELRRDGIVKSPSRGYWELAPELVDPPDELESLPNLSLVPAKGAGVGKPQDRILAAFGSDTSVVLSAALVANRSAMKISAASNALYRLVRKGRLAVVTPRHGRIGATYRLAPERAPDAARPPKSTVSTLKWQDKIKFLAEWEGVSPDKLVDKLIKSHKRRRP